MGPHGRRTVASRMLLMPKWPSHDSLSFPSASASLCLPLPSSNPHLVNSGFDSGRVSPHRLEGDRGVRPGPGGRRGGSGSDWRGCGGAASNSEAGPAPAGLDPVRQPVHGLLSRQCICTDITHPSSTWSLGVSINRNINNVQIDGEYGIYRGYGFPAAFRLQRWTRGGLLETIPAYRGKKPTY